MSKLLLASIFASALLVSPAYAADEAACQQLFEKADANKDGTVGGPEVAAFSEPYLKASGQAAGNSTEVTITKEQFADACMKDAFKDVSLPQ
ncbi:MAG TPA: hypothetical protein VH933_13350 [Aestuariivirgaceae bacterium]|jgi:hypothetical protein